MWSTAWQNYLFELNKDFSSQMNTSLFQSFDGHGSTLKLKTSESQKTDTPRAHVYVDVW